MKNLGEVIDIKDIPRKKDILTTTEVIVGDEINHKLMSQIPKNFIAFDNFFNIKYSEYDELANNMGISSTTEFYWEEIKPTVECFSFDNGLNNGGTKTSESSLASIIQNMIGGLYRSDKWNNRYFREINNESNSFTSACLYIMLKGSVIEEIINNNEPVLIVAESTMTRQKINDNGQLIYAYENFVGGSTQFLQGGNYNFANNAQSIETGKIDYDFYASKFSTYIIGAYFFNTLAWETSQLEANIFNYNSPTKDITMIGLGINFTSILKDITFQNFKVFRRVRGAGELYMDLPPFYFIPQYQDMAKYNYSGQGDNAIASKELTYRLGIKKYIGNKNA